MHILEEIHELLEGLDKEDTDAIFEELGDCFFQLIFCAKLGEKTGRFTLRQVLERAREKFIRRHPHVFAGVAVRGLDEIAENWERIKREEKTERRRFLDGIPGTLGALARAQKVIRKGKQGGFVPEDMSIEKDRVEGEEERVGFRLLQFVGEAAHKGVDVESALRSALRTYEEELEKRYVEKE